MAERKNKVTMSNVAQECGVSLSTVSLVLNDKPGIPGVTRAKVMEAARKLGYIQRTPVPVLTKPTYLETIGVIVKRAQGDSAPPSSNIFFSHVIAGVEAGCRQEGITLLYSTLSVDENNNSLDIPPIIQDLRVDGLILVGSYIDEPLYAALRERSIPTVLAEAYCSSCEFDSVIIENKEGVYKAVNYLLERGHRHIAFVGSFPDSRISFRYRRQGYVKALEDFGIRQTYYADCPHNNRAAVVDATYRLLKNHPQVTAIIGCNDEVAVIAIQGAIQAGRSVPRDVSIVGFDNNAIAEMSIPALTTVNVDKVSLGRLAVELMINRAEDPLQGGVVMRLQTQLVERQSVRDLRQT